MGIETTPAWERAYAELCAFAAAQETVRVAPDSLSVARETRPAFYERVESVQKLLARDVLGDARVDEVVAGAQACQAARQRIVDATNLTAFNLPDMLENFAAQPERTVAKPLFSLVLDALQNGREAGELKDAARRVLPPFVEGLQRSAYEAWAYCTVVADLRPVRFYGVYSPDTVYVEPVEADTVTVGAQVTSPERRIPEAVFVTEDGRTFAMKTEATTRRAATP